MLVLIIGIIIGALLGIIINNEFNKLNIKSILKLVKKELVAAYDEGVKYGSIKLKLDRINEISSEQIKYFGALERPNASAAHSRHKNSIVSQIKAMEAEKIELFKSILDSGVDPLLTVVIEGETKSMRASELLPILTNETTDTTPQSKTDSIPPMNTRALSIVKNTKENTDDGSQSDPSNPAIH